MRRPSTPALVSGLLATGALAAAAPAGAATCTYDDLLHSVTIQSAGEGRIGVTRIGTQLAMIAGTDRPSPCPGPRAETGGATVANTDRVDLSGTTSGDLFKVDLSGGALEPGRTPEASTERSEVEVFVNGRGGNDQFEVDGTAGADFIAVGPNGQTMLNADPDVDVNLRFPADSPMSLTYSGNDGDDFISGRGGAGLSSLAPSNLPLTLFGNGGNDVLLDGLGAGGDVIRAGARQDTLIGNTGNDTLIANDGNGGDSVNGGGGTDHGFSEARDEILAERVGLDTFSLTEAVTFTGAAVGKLALSHPVRTIAAGRPAKLRLGWRTPGPWRTLKGLTVRLYDGGRPLGTATIRPGSRTTTRRLFTSARTGHAGHRVSAKLRLRVPRGLAGHDLRVAIEAADSAGHHQLEPSAGLLHVRR